MSKFDKFTSEEKSVIHTALQEKIRSLSNIIRDPKVPEENKEEYKEELVTANLLKSEVYNNDN